MSAVDVAGAVAIGFAAGMSGGLLGVGGGVLFVPGLVLFLDQSQLGPSPRRCWRSCSWRSSARWRQHSYGNVRLREGLVIGGLSPLGVLAV